MSSHITALQGATTTALQRQNKRIASIDILRGLVMLLMLVDHVRERLYYHHPISDPMTLDETSVALFFTRIATHFCAPVFVFLTGLSAWLYAHPAQGAPRSASAYLLKRGLFIIGIEVTLINFSWFGAYDALYLQVMWAIGLSMIVLSLMVKAPYWLIGTSGLAIVLGHNALEPVQFSTGESGYFLWTILHDRGYLYASEAFKVKASYPALPWMGVIMLGYFVGPLYQHTVTSASRQKNLILIGVSCLLLLALLRGLNLYGETLPWQVGDSFIESARSFLNYTKYPPSLNFLLFTLGIATLVLAGLDTVNNRVSQFIESFGSAPLFFYIVHLYILLIGYKVLFAIYGATQGSYWGLDSLWQVWAIALVLALALYFPTVRFARFKRTSGIPWLKYF
ncbi:DUF1624 domain-containing protein [Shewanella gelidii]|uniref:Membrane protein n=1 Tax=Shewanella gelidii TaxID=1642821 RepID=A0A917JP89_9GAMM|nr:heparan-alpha-glucosaminide N-acetyltransferase domain-containing protein [Shewanella gelidii]MCL1097638.1 heparan-alpha-glucosaminide N-acetyltransferase domain-containing protein [Shewanella gelidii]GGI80032.1 membrane protein [Shewanella gelidii]